MVSELQAKYQYSLVTIVEALELLLKVDDLVFRAQDLAARVLQHA
jgi:hypothetical protein